jgi:hypothetical protein
MHLPSSRRSSVLPPAPPPRPPAGGPAPPHLKADPDVNCPRCHTILTDPYGIGHCPRCGYCRSLEVEGVAVLAAAARRPKRWALTVRGLRRALGATPMVFAAVLVALVAVVPLALLADRRFPPGSRERALWSAGHLASGTLLLLAGQAWAVTVLKRLRELVTWGDLLSPLHLWGLAVRRLPETGWAVGLGSSGMLAILSAVLWVGGLSYWFRLTPAPDEQDAAPTQAVIERRKEAQNADEWKRTVRSLADRQARSAARTPLTGSTAAPLARGATDDARPTTTCVIVGFVPASAGREPGLVLARLHQGQLTFAGVVRDKMSQKPELLDRLSKLGTARPAVEGLDIKAVWVRPELFCEVHQSGEDDKGKLVDPSMKSLVED